MVIGRNIVLALFDRGGGLFPKGVAHILNACIAACAVVVVVMAVVVVVMAVVVAVVVIVVI